jgi:hypothetical protein
MTYTGWIARWFRRSERVSGAWLQAQALEETKTGWLDGPRWRLKTEAGDTHSDQNEAA